MIFEKLGLSAWITDPEGNQLPEYQVQEGEDQTIQCWIPSTEGTRFQIRWKVLGNPHPGLDVIAHPYLDGLPCSGLFLSKKEIVSGEEGVMDKHRTGPTTARPYEFGKRELTDKDTGFRLNESAIKSLSTIRVQFRWGTAGKREAWKESEETQDTGPIHEKTAKKGHSGAAKLGKTISTSGFATSSTFKYAKIKPIAFVFNYAPEDWLQARDILPRSPEPELQEDRGTLKRERSTTPEVIDIDGLETDDDEIQIIKHMIPAPIANNKRQRTERQGSTRPKKEED